EIKRARRARNRRLSCTYICMALASLGLWFIRASWICAVVGIAMAIILWIGARADKSVSLLFILGFPLVGFCVGALHFDLQARAGYFIVGAGLLFLLEGLIALLVHLVRHPAPQV